MTTPRLYRTEILAITQDNKPHFFVVIDDIERDVEINGIKQLLAVRRTLVKKVAPLNQSRPVMPVPAPISPASCMERVFIAAVIVGASLSVGTLFAYFS